MKIYSYIVIVIVGIAIVAGFFIAGTPQETRAQKADQQRISDLQNIQWMIISYWQAKEELPANLATLVDETQGILPPIDPKTSAEYGYKILDEKALKFELCADFNTSNKGGGDKAAKPMPISSDQMKSYRISGEIEWNWQHEIGRACFERNIDPDKYPPFNKNNPQ